MNESYNDEGGLLTEEELDLVTNYVGGFLNEAETEAFRDRMADDDAFFAKAAPIIGMMHSPPASVLAAAAEAKHMAAKRRVRAATIRRTIPGWKRHLAIAVGTAAAVVEEVTPRTARLLALAAALILTLNSGPRVVGPAIEFAFGTRPPERQKFSDVGKKRREELAQAALAVASGRSHPRSTQPVRVVAAVPTIKLDSASERKARSAVAKAVANADVALETRPAADPIPTTFDFTSPTVPATSLAWAPEDTIGLRSGRDLTAGVPDGIGPVSGQNSLAGEVAGNLNDFGHWLWGKLRDFWNWATRKD